MQLKKAVLVAGAGGIIDEAAAAAAVRGAALYRPRVCSVSPSLACQVRGRWRRWMLYRDEKVAIVRLGLARRDGKCSLNYRQIQSPSARL
jgi:hypothetical protein